ncbi:MAG: rRNA pseudouridine synthase [Thermogemmatispora sp.]|uniref:pseudouridine synthase n=1 Tax=Thermogemmatispora sp. TaxID=1968838 RepID=UPI002601D3F7|nr:pseudouridine synthase [Thermogemmatispora sp.]MBX5455475.1 rRNA pseudouridine synthase [Thermogemmatispora sp.]
MSASTGTERLARFLAHAGVASRRHAEALIFSGRVQVNGETVTTPATRIDPERDRITVDGRPIQAPERHLYLMLHKPAGYVSTVSDPQGRPTVLDLLPKELRHLRLYPVGRLDLETTGLLLLTNDGEFALQMTHPRFAPEKRYRALVRGHPSPNTLEQLRQGVMIKEDDGRLYRTAPVGIQQLHRTAAGTWLELRLHEGRKRQIRRMLASVGHPVLELQRVAIGPLTLGDLPPGAWRPLTEAEIAALRSPKSQTASSSAAPSPAKPKKGRS